MINAADAIIVGGGFSGQLAAIHLKGLDNKHEVVVFEQEDYPLCHSGFMILPPLTRQLLKRVTPLNNYKFNEGRFLIFKIADMERDIVIETIDTAVVNYLDFVQMFYQIALQIGVKVCHNQRVLRVDTRRKIVELHTGQQLSYGNIIEAGGAAASVKHENVLFKHFTVDRDIYCYPMQCAYTLEKADENAICKVVPTADNLPKKDDTIKIGDMNGYIDHFIDIHTKYTIISAISAAEAVYSGKGARAYYRSMENIADDIEYSLLLRQLVIDDMPLLQTRGFSELLASVLLFGTPYKKLYEYLKSGGTNA